ncbi:16S rRNA (adenine(1518)-N(6)/adenine(1519)-N(6))-dimethyltransferase RsmA [Anaerosalibacter bizertensis]|uniref:Ribosomal RNA small subunit methyltransferase A n=1 Tax=Anaerosalibacter bizertensis TaxID=932217 RepID=A0A9Q4ACQ9_9FIRM|nr:16S rRNA (adenine(1518)-N(6)/adenine(1519)-N(6))-dimethyltransferase RsmA [Anaerosalibacter bizertensis]MCB5560025.1 16S rRNA (adenine(1518)-N(6)/adenine(1519)-N(6))-dimethyltransferase RsmA [Anaerosalibacter bizertensis]MCG4565317.1 16S rRNA (adenine(1518)-N(6)/adenine(1519)-N(6))-dimethyltransferase RsmA [Anaerosalibacter bizertensis]MCG4586176.1 16S rRNA (adenine(1518)-N(6)/adenine(1519)-N(6))-dimethyltransferase RsmA [Anaerosalibacter bizertensis]
MDKKRLYSPSYVKEIIDKYNFRFSKSLGQNFLIDGNIVRKICEEGEISKEDDILEIGPGIGTLTEELSYKANKVVAVELDKSLFPILDETLAGCNNVEIVPGDILKIDLSKLFSEKFESENIKIVANLPYYITTPIIGRLLEEELDIDSILVMVQSEVAERMKASPGTKDYGSLSVFVQYYTDPEIVLLVPKTAFMPRPNVDSAVIKLKIRKEKIELKDRETFFKVVKAAFSQRRKTILNSLSSGLKTDKATIRAILEKADIDPKLRAENLTIEDFSKISAILPPFNIY